MRTGAVSEQSTVLRTIQDSLNAQKQVLDRIGTNLFETHQRIMQLRKLAVNDSEFQPK